MAHTKFIEFLNKKIEKARTEYFHAKAELTRVRQVSGKKEETFNALVHVGRRYGIKHIDDDNDDERF